MAFAERNVNDRFLGLAEKINAKGSKSRKESLQAAWDKNFRYLRNVAVVRGIEHSELTLIIAAPDIDETTRSEGNTELTARADLC